MKNDINKVAETIAKEISKYPANTPYDQVGSLHYKLGFTKRESEAHLMSGWFLKKVEKMTGDEENYRELSDQLVAKALEVSGK